MTQRHDIGLKHTGGQRSMRQTVHLSPAGSGPPSPRGSLSHRSRYSGSESGTFNNIPGIETADSQRALAHQDRARTENHGSESPTSAVPAIGRAPSYHETMKVESRQLSTIDIACLILNKMVGTGIFTTPGYVLALTHGKGLSLFFWAAGGAYVILWFVRFCIWY
jgi:hypothetical protein